MNDETSREGGGWLSRLRRGLSRSSDKLTGGISGLFTRRRLDDDALEDLEELLIGADFGVGTATKITEVLAKTRFNQEVTADEVRGFVAEEVAKLLQPVAQTITIHEAHKPHVILVCGVNGSGKTTTIAKLAHLFKSVGLEVVLAAGDTFRAAAHRAAADLGPARRLRGHRPRAWSRRGQPRLRRLCPGPLAAGGHPAH